MNTSSICGSISVTTTGAFNGMILAYNTSKAAINMRKSPNFSKGSLPQCAYTVCFHRTIWLYIHTRMCTQRLLVSFACDRRVAESVLLCASVRMAVDHVWHCLHSVLLCASFHMAVDCTEHPLHSSSCSLPQLYLTIQAQTEHDMIIVAMMQRLLSWQMTSKMKVSPSLPFIRVGSRPTWAKQPRASWGTRLPWTLKPALQASTRSSLG